jgi:hypothetical protein
MNTQTTHATFFNSRFASADELFAAAELLGIDKSSIKATADQGEWIAVNLAPAAPAKPEKPVKAKGKAKGKVKAKPEGKAKPEAKKGLEKRAAKIAADLAKPKPAKVEKESAFRDFKANPKWGKLTDRRWLGKWAQLEASAKLGKLPDVGPAKPDFAAVKEDGKEWAEAVQGAFAGMFTSATHWPFRKRIAALAAMIRAKDEKALKALEIKEISTTPIMLGKLRDLAIAALAVKAQKAKAEAKPEATAPVENTAS